MCKRSILLCCLLVFFANVEGDLIDTYCGERNTDFPYKLVGNVAGISEFPWLVSLQLTKEDGTYVHFCGGTIVHKSWILTAAQCILNFPKEQITALAGAYSLQESRAFEQRRGIERIVTKDVDLNSTYKYPDTSSYTDIALLKLDCPFEINAYSMVLPICLPKPDEKFEGDILVSGWGTIRKSGLPADRLQRLTRSFISNELCQERYNKLSGYPEPLILKDCQVCTEYRGNSQDTCQSDYGGPLICPDKDFIYYICGIVSEAIGCEDTNYPTVYTKVSCFTSWIEDVIQSDIITPSDC